MVVLHVMGSGLVGIVFPFYQLRSQVIRALTAVKLNSYIAILVSQKYKNPYYSSGAKGKIFTFIAIVNKYMAVHAVES